VQTEPIEIKAPLRVLLAALRAVMPMQSTVDYRPHLCGVLFRAEGERLTLVATDGWGLAKVVIALSAALAERREFLLPRPAVAEVARALLALRERKARVARSRGWGSKPVPAPAQTFSMRVVRGGRDVEIDTKIGRARLRVADEQFPPFDKVIPRLAGNGCFSVGISNEFVSRALDAARHVGEGSALSMGSGPLDPLRVDVAQPIDGVLEAVYVLMPRRVEMPAREHAEAAE
jgi:hypothetical protein